MSSDSPYGGQSFDLDARPERPVVGDLHSEIAALRIRTRLIASRGSSADLSVAVDVLEQATEELVVADEELKAQRATLDEMTHQLTDERLQAERLWGAIPVASVRTDSAGLIRDADATAADTFRTALPMALRTPLVRYVEDSERRALRTTIQQTLQDGCARRVLLTLRGRPSVTRLVLAFPETVNGRPLIRWIVLPHLVSWHAGEDPLDAVRPDVERDPSDVRALLEAADLDELCRRAAEALPAGLRLAIVSGEPHTVPEQSGQVGEVMPQLEILQLAQDSYRTAAARLMDGPDGAVLALPLHGHDRSYGVLLGWADSSEVFDPAVRYLLQLVALTAARLIGRQDDLRLVSDLLIELHEEKSPTAGQPVPPATAAMDRRARG